MQVLSSIHTSSQRPLRQHLYNKGQAGRLLWLNGTTRAKPSVLIVCFSKQKRKGRPSTPLLCERLIVVP